MSTLQFAIPGVRGKIDNNKALLLSKVYKHFFEPRNIGKVGSKKNDPIEQKPMWGKTVALMHAVDQELSNTKHIKFKTPKQLENFIAAVAKKERFKPGVAKQATRLILDIPKNYNDFFQSINLLVPTLNKVAQLAPHLDEKLKDKFIKNPLYKVKKVLSSLMPNASIKIRGNGLKNLHSSAVGKNNKSLKSSLTKNEVFNKIRKILVNLDIIGKNTALKNDTNLEDLGLDSLRIFQLFQFLEEEFLLDLSRVDTLGSRTIGNIVNTVISSTNSNK